MIAERAWAETRFLRCFLPYLLATIGVAAAVGSCAAGSGAAVSGVPLVVGWWGGVAGDIGGGDAGSSSHEHGQGCRQATSHPPLSARIIEASEAAAKVATAASWWRHR